MKKNEEYIVDIIDNGYEGEGIAKINNFTIFIPGAIKGEKVKILIVKVTTSYAFGKILEIIENSKDRVGEVDCNTYKRCGGCNLRHMNYQKTLELKRDIVQNLVNKNRNEMDIILNNVVVLYLYLLLLNNYIFLQKSLQHVHIHQVFFYIYFF